MSYFGTVATGHPFTTFIGSETLKMGGNAFDAAIAAGFAACFSEPLLTSLGGGGILLSQSEQSQFECFDFFTNFPGLDGLPASPNFITVDVDFSSATQSFKTGPGTIAVPGTLKGFIEIQNQKGALSLDKILAPVIKACCTGIKISETQNYILDILAPLACLTVEGKSLYAPAGKLLKTGDTFKNPLYANFLKKLPKYGCEEIYSGNKLDGILNSKDLSSYRVISETPLSFEYRDATIYSAPPPAHGGHYLKLLFSMFEKYDCQNLKWGSYEHLKSISDVLIKLEQGKGKEHFTPFTKGTTHISVSDSKSNCVSLSLTNGEGSGVFIPDTGIMLNNMLGEDDLCSHDPQDWKPGHRIPSMMAPSLIVRKGKSSIITGSGGSKRIRSSLLQVISNLLDFNMDLKNAVISPRINWDGEALQMEPGFPDKSIQQLRNEIPVSLWQNIEFYFGGTHSSVDGSEAYSDPRRGGDAMLLKM